MGDKTKIEWTDATWNPVRGCSVVSEGCRNCYAMQVAARFSGVDPKTGKPLAYHGLAYRNSSGAHWTGKVRLVEEHLEDPLRWKRPRRIFVNSMSDLFHEELDEHDIGQVFAIMALAKQHTFQVLTKRPARMLAILETARICFDFDEPLPNVWLGVSVEDQATADERISLLMKTPAAVRWVSAEPLLGPINFTAIRHQLGVESYEVFDALYHKDSLNRGQPRPGLDQVVVGGESGVNARPMHPDWVRSIRDQCEAADVPFFFKQWGAWIEVDGPRCRSIDQSPGLKFWLTSEGKLEPRTKPGHSVYSTSLVRRVGKKAAGHLLDGRAHRQYPQIQSAVEAGALQK